MSTNRRSFIRNITLGSGVLAATPLISATGKAEKEKLGYIKKAAERKPAMSFNMCGYAAPKLDKVRIGFVGIGDRGSDAVERMTYIDGVEIVALCDIRQAAVDGAQKILANAGLPKAKEFGGGDLTFKDLMDIDAVIHLAWRTNIPDCVRHPKESTYQNMDMTVHLLQVCKEAGIKRLVFPSTASFVKITTHLFFAIW